MAFTKITASGIGSTETVTLDGLTVINNVSIGGTLTYEDVTNIDSVGLITARAGVVVGSGITLSKDGDIFATGIVTATSFVGSGSGLTGVASTDNIRTNTNATFLQNINVSGTVTATSYAGSGANLTNLPAANLTGTLPAIDGSALTGIAGTANVRTGILDVAGIATFRSDVNLPNINGGQIGGRRNIIINGAMNVAQRGTSDTGVGYKTVDRFFSQKNGTQAITQSQDTDVPTGQGFSKSLKYDCTTANASPSAANYLSITYRIEAQDLQQIANGTSNAKKLTLSFWVKSPKTGNHAVGLYKQDNTQRQQTKTYSVSAANTWEKKTITYDGDTSGGGIADDVGFGFQIDWHLLAGSSYTSVDSTSWVNYSDAAWAYGHAVNVLDDTANNFYITGVQLEVGSQATEFEYRTYGEELQLCKRYFNMLSQTHRSEDGDDAFIAHGFYWQNNRFMAPLRFDVPLRTEAFSLYKVIGSNYFRIYNNGQGSHQINDIGGLNSQASVQSAHLNITDATSSGAAGMFFCNNSAARLGFDAEL